MFTQLPSPIPRDISPDESRVALSQKSTMSLFTPPVVIGTTIIGKTDVSSSSGTLFGAGKSLDSTTLTISGSAGPVSIALTGSSNALSFSALTASINSSALTASYVTASLQTSSGSAQYLKLFTPSGSLSVTANSASNALGLYSASVKQTTTFVEAAVAVQPKYVFDNLSESGSWNFGGSTQPGVKDPNSQYAAFAGGIYTATGGTLVFDSLWATAMTASVGPGYFFAPIYGVYNNSTVTDGVYLP